MFTRSILINGLASPARSVLKISTTTPSRSVFSPAPSSINRSKKPAPLHLESRLNQELWRSFSLEEAENTGNEEMVTALEYPEYEGKMDRDMHPSQPQIMYAGPDGALWSPGLPKPGAALDRLRNSLMSPSKKSNFSNIVRRDVTAPSPNDPFAAFPSFAAAMEVRDSLMSPGKKTSFSNIVRKDFTAPSPNDPFAAFPSFTTAIGMGSMEGSS